MATASSFPIDPRPTPEIAAAERLYLRDLPGLLQTKFGRWVVYTPEGCIAEGDDCIALYKECARRGLQRGRFLVTRVEPDADVAEISPSWYLEPAVPDQHNENISKGS